MANIRKTQNTFTSGVLSAPVLARTDIQKYGSGCKQIINCIVKPHGGISNRPGTYYVDDIPTPGRLIEFSYSVEQNYALLFFDKKMRIYKSGGVVVYPPEHALAGQIVEIVTPYPFDALTELKYAQSADLMFIAHPAYPPTTLTRTAHHEWTFETMTFDPVIATPQIPTLLKAKFSSEAGKDIEYKISAVSESGEESYPSPAVSVAIDNIWPQGATVTVSWGAVENALHYNIYKSSRGFFGWIGTVEASDILKFVDDYIQEDSGDGPKEAKNPFKDNNFPGVVGIYQQRLMFARSNSKPQTIWTSVSGNLNNFSISYPLKDDDSIEAAADSLQMNEIRHFFPLKNVLVLTSGAEIMMSAGKNADGITPTGNLRFDIQSHWGCSSVPPLVAGNNILIVQNSGRIVRDLYYALAEDGYIGTELSILASDLLESPIVDWTYQNEPHHLIYACREDGKLLGLTYMREQEVYAWCMMETLGEYKSVLSIRNGRDDDVYFLIKRDDKYYIEYQKNAKPGDKREDAFFVDCGLSYNGEAY